MDRIYNVERGRKRKPIESIDETPKKRGRPKKVINLEGRYPKLQSSTDDGTRQQKEDALNKELEKENPRKEVLLALMKETFHGRRQDILHSAVSVVSKLGKYSALRMPSVVSS